MSNVTHRLSEYLTEKKITIYAFEKQIGVTQNVIQRAIKGSTSFNASVLEKIAANYPDLNFHWLITGHGEMSVAKGSGTIQTSDSELTKQLLQVQQDLINCMKQNNELKESSAGVKRITTA